MPTKEIQKETVAVIKEKKEMSQTKRKEPALKVFKETKNDRLARQNTVLALLEAHYGDPKPELDYTTPFELLIAVILSAQCTDKRVNIVTKKLFEQVDTPEKMAALAPEELQAMIKSCGLSESKAKNICATCKILVSEYGQTVPQDIETLQTLPGVGRKTANVVASVAFGVPAIAVDTHVFRVSNRMGLASAKDVLNTEKQLMALIPKEKWSKAHHWLIFHGRRVCSARNPKCGECFVQEACAQYLQEYKGKKELKKD